MTNARRKTAADAEITEHVRALMKAHSPRHAARLLGVSRETAVSIAAGLPVTRGTIALLREQLRAGVPVALAPNQPSAAISFVPGAEARR